MLMFHGNGNVDVQPPGRRAMVSEGKLFKCMYCVWGAFNFVFVLRKKCIFTTLLVEYKGTR